MAIWLLKYFEEEAATAYRTEIRVSDWSKDEAVMEFSRIDTGEDRLEISELFSLRFPLEGR